MAKQSKHALREYHLLVKRTDAGFTWQIRYDRHARPFKETSETFKSHDDAESAGKKVLDDWKAELATQG